MLKFWADLVERQVNAKNVIMGRFSLIQGRTG
jgi:hypothetical protein